MITFFFQKINISEPPTGCIIVSSEVESIQNVIQDGHEITKHQELPKSHFNTSLIAGKVSDILKAMDDWRELYSEYLNLIIPRYLEEVAFCKSALINDIKIYPISSDIQGNWKNRNPKSQIFHYGGDYKEKVLNRIEQHLYIPVPQQKISFYKKIIFDE